MQRLEVSGALRRLKYSELEVVFYGFETWSPILREAQAEGCRK